MLWWSRELGGVQLVLLCVWLGGDQLVQLDWSNECPPGYSCLDRWRARRTQWSGGVLVPVVTHIVGQKFGRKMKFYTNLFCTYGLLANQL